MNEPLNALVSRGHRALDSMYDASEALAALRVVRRSTDGLVTVEVDSHGSVIGLELADDLTRESAERLTTLVVQTATAAARDALAAREDVLRSMQTSLTET
ncbi:YbaB/EbfC family nucleoid-associated protein [Rhodococcoides kyotonense]|uniref:Conserved DNA-binding protein YbaB n=1 Tax=Rhodococcoides kyotonense TaxID=398843 RepID=A0A239MTC0_9NOCA|nr:YbaB/EbfC family nucleoid-associated protein [Rhodococcus kyotonensis]SNT46006.1 Conserved DNA-binding protein YbaB [Rhodococcus kyotonensis]